MLGCHCCKYREHGLLRQNASQSGKEVSAFGGSSSLHLQDDNDVGRDRQFYRNDVIYLLDYKATNSRRK